MSTFLPPPLALSRAPATEQVQAHLMPFQLDYTGPAPVSTFLLLSQAVPSAINAEEPIQDAKEAESENKREQTDAQSDLPEYTSSFRGRHIHASPLPLPEGWTGAVYNVPPPPSADAVPVLNPETLSAQPSNENAKTSAPPCVPPTSTTKQTSLKGPKRFTLDSDSDDSESDAEEVTHFPDAPPTLSMEDATAGQLIIGPDGFIDEADGVSSAFTTPAPTLRPAQTLTPIADFATMPGDSRSAFLVWFPDGPGDVGDDRLFRTLGEWQSVVVHSLHAY